MENKKFEGFSEQELVEAAVFSHGLSKAEKEKADEEIKALRMRRLRDMSDQQKMYADLIRLRIKIEDAIESEAYSSDQSFGYFLKRYLKIINKTQRAFSRDIGLHYTKLNRILKDKEDPNIPLVHRLEKHSGKTISAVLWWKLLVKKVEHFIREDKETKEEEGAKVSNPLSFE